MNPYAYPFKGRRMTSFLSVDLCILSIFLSRFLACACVRLARAIRFVVIMTLRLAIKHLLSHASSEGADGALSIHFKDVGTLRFCLLALATEGASADAISGIRRSVNDAIFHSVHAWHPVNDHVEFSSFVRAVHWMRLCRDVSDDEWERVVPALAPRLPRLVRLLVPGVIVVEGKGKGRGMGRGKGLPPHPPLAPPLPPPLPPPAPPAPPLRLPGGARGRRSDRLIAKLKRKSTALRAKVRELKVHLRTATITATSHTATYCFHV